MLNPTPPLHTHREERRTTVRLLFTIILPASVPNTMIPHQVYCACISKPIPLTAMNVFNPDTIYSEELLQSI